MKSLSIDQLDIMYGEDMENDYRQAERNMYESIAYENKLSKPSYYRTEILNGFTVPDGYCLADVADTYNVFEADPFFKGMAFLITSLDCQYGHPGDEIDEMRKNLADTLMKDGYETSICDKLWEIAGFEAYISLSTPLNLTEMNFLLEHINKAFKKAGATALFCVEVAYVERLNEYALRNPVSSFCLLYAPGAEDMTLAEFLKTSDDEYCCALRDNWRIELGEYVSSDCNSLLSDKFTEKYVNARVKELYDAFSEKNKGGVE